MRSTFKVLVPLAFLTLAGCLDTGNNAGNGGLPPGFEACKQTITQAKLDDFLKSGLAPSIAGLNGVGSSKCESKVEVNGSVKKYSAEGFMEVEYFPTMTLSDELKVTRRGHETYVHLRVTMNEVTQEDLQAMQKWFKDATGKAVVFRPSTPRWSEVLVGDLPEVPMWMERIPMGDGSTADVMTFSHASIGGLVEDALYDFTRGASTLTFVRGALGVSKTVMMAQFGREQTIDSAAFEPVSNQQYIDLLWQRIRAYPSTLRIDDFSFQMWMEKVTGTWSTMGLSAYDVRSKWGEAYDVAVNAWNPPSQPYQVDHYYERINALRWLSKVDPGSPAKAYAAYLAKLSPVIGESKALYTEILRMVENNPYTPAQEKFLLATAMKLLKANSSDAWSDAKALAIGTGYNEAQINHIVSVAAWAAENNEREALKKAKEWVLEKGLDAKGLERLKSLHEWLKGETTFHSYDKATSYVFEYGFGEAQIKALKDMVAVIKKIENSSFNALDRAERYFTESRLSAADVVRLMNMALWLVEAKSKYEALDTAEEYIIERRLTVAQIDAIKFAYAFILKADGKFRALDQAEELVIDKGLGLEQITVMQEAQQWLAKVDGSSQSLNKAKGYVVDKGMTRAMFGRLKAAFEKYKKDGSSFSALIKAEQEVFGR